jgi:hypothetical protein
MKSPEERLAAFRLLCLKVHREKAILSNEEAKKFFLYWTERSDGGKKHKWEFEKTFNVTRRMCNWRDYPQRWGRFTRHKEEPTSPRG